jgi:hypothetical protein
LVREEASESDARVRHQRQRPSLHDGQSMNGGAMTVTNSIERLAPTVRVIKVAPPRRLQGDTASGQSW